MKSPREITMAAKKDYRIGYKRPPLATRFKPGQSGNPAGRPKGRKNMKTAVNEIVNGEVDVTVGGKRRCMTLLEALLYRIFNSAVAGDLKTIPHALNLARMYDDDDGAGAGDENTEAQKRELVRQLLASCGGRNDGSGTQ
jgi:hypothetical protein